MYQFLKTQDTTNPHDHSVVEVRLPDNDQTLDTLLAEFTYFLRGCGFEFEGSVEVVPPITDTCIEP